eukprot:6724050-Ditylum_brightwellii.AAC.1
MLEQSTATNPIPDDASLDYLTADYNNNNNDIIPFWVYNYYNNNTHNIYNGIPGNLPSWPAL